MTFDRKKLGAELVRDEGERLRVYRCTAGKRTVGVGRNLDDVGISAAETAMLGITVASCIALGIDQVQSRTLLDNDIVRCEGDLDRALPWWRILNPVRQRVLLNMCFNMGIGRVGKTGLLSFTNTLARIQRGDFAGAAAGMRASKWHDQVGKRALRLEAMMETGKEPA